jgi:hypothetical protein
MDEQADGLDEVIRRLEAMRRGRKAKFSRLEFPLVVDVVRGTIRSVKPDDKVVPIPRRRDT